MDSQRSECAGNMEATYDEEHYSVLVEVWHCFRSFAPPPIHGVRQNQPKDERVKRYLTRCLLSESTLFFGSKAPYHCNPDSVGHTRRSCHKA